MIKEQITIFISTHQSCLILFIVAGLCLIADNDSASGRIAGILNSGGQMSRTSSP